MAAIAIAVPTVAVGTNDHLVPDGPFVLDATSFALGARRVFSGGFSEDVSIRVFVQPTFDPEYLVGVKSVGSEYFVILLAVDAQVAEKPKSGMPDSSGHPPRVLEETGSRLDNAVAIEKLARISSGTAERIRLVWREELLNVRHASSPSLRIDGTTYWLSMFVDGYGDVGGHLSGYEAGSRMESLVKLVNMLAEYAAGSTSEEAVENALNEIERARAHESPSGRRGSAHP